MEQHPQLPLTKQRNSLVDRRLIPSLNVLFFTYMLIAGVFWPRLSKKLQSSRLVEILRYIESVL